MAKQYGIKLQAIEIFLIGSLIKEFSKQKPVITDENGRDITEEVLVTSAEILIKMQNSLRKARAN